MRYGLGIFDIILSAILSRAGMYIIFSLMVISLLLLIFARKRMNKWQKVLAWTVFILCIPYAVLVAMLVVMFSV